MLYANTKEGEKIKATPKAQGFCNCCQNQLIPKCGTINRWHWSHKANDCDNWNEGETAWHINWKDIVKPEYCEIKVENHRADIKINGKVIELQNSPISVEEIQEREQHYKDMIWVFNAIPYKDNLNLLFYQDYVKFRWKWARKTILNTKKPIFLDLGMYQKYIGLDEEYQPQFENIGEVLLQPKKFYPNSGRGWGKLISKEEFVNKYLKEGLKDEYY